MLSSQVQLTWIVANEGIQDMARSDIYLAYMEYLPNLPPVILLHGLTNCKETWQDCAQVIASQTGCKVIAYDARNHGDSGWSETIGYDVMTDDLKHFMDTNDIPKAIIVGHSMGGKTGMNFALKYPERTHLLILEDISIHTPPHGRAGVLKYMQQLKDVLLTIPPDMELLKAKKLAAAYLTGGEDTLQTSDNCSGRKMWDGNNLPLILNSDGKFQWKTNCNVIEDSTKQGRFLPLDPNPIYDGPVLLIYGTKSPFRVLDNKECMLKQFPRTIYQPIEDGTHALHQEYPEIFTRILCDFILKQRKENLKSSIFNETL